MTMSEEQIETFLGYHLLPNRKICPCSTELPTTRFYTFSTCHRCGFMGYSTNICMIRHANLPKGEDVYTGGFCQDCKSKSKEDIPPTKTGTWKDAWF